MKFAGVLASTNKANVESATVDNRPAGVYKLGADEAKCSRTYNSWNNSV